MKRNKIETILTFKQKKERRLIPYALRHVQSTA